MSVLHAQGLPYYRLNPITCTLKYNDVDYQGSGSTGYEATFNAAALINSPNSITGKPIYGNLEKAEGEVRIPIYCGRTIQHIYVPYKLTQTVN